MPLILKENIQSIHWKIPIIHRWHFERLEEISLFMQAFFFFSWQVSLCDLLLQNLEAGLRIREGTAVMLFFLNHLIYTYICISPSYMHVHIWSNCTLEGLYTMALEPYIRETRLGFQIPISYVSSQNNFFIKK